MSRWFFSSSFFLFLGNWIGIIALNWYVFETFHNPVYLGWINFARLVPILVFSLYAGRLCDQYSRSMLIKLLSGLSFLFTFFFTIVVITSEQLPIIVILFYACLRGCVSAFETPIRNAILPAMSKDVNVSVIVSRYSFVINICRSIGPAIAGLLIGLGFVSYTFALQAFCLFISLLLCLPITVERVSTKGSQKKSFAIQEMKQYFSYDLKGRGLFISSLTAMAFGFSYTTILPVLTDFHFPGEAEVFGIAMSFAAVGGIVATLTLPKVLTQVNEETMYYRSLCLFSISLIGVLIPLKSLLFVCLFAIGFFGQWTRSTNRIYFQNKIPDEKRGRIMSVILMDRGMIPLGALVISFLADSIGIMFTFAIMAIGTFIPVITNFKKIDSIDEGGEQCYKL
ncbi:MFS transporter [Bacillus solimangrovi]|uniref:Multidrug MFS transporter n=1 Tax=Bacillus solimangrovi TaxID=1305675 RepID=A0A1E5LCE9_9BACI|nr:MFS transporter [Bacillus solimangrovi]OEH91747.1 multidrug MFS transporter [Bacillus solimangrovi]